MNVLLQSTVAVKAVEDRMLPAPWLNPWQRVQESGLLTADQVRAVHARIAGVNPADLTRRINQIQLRLTELSRDKTEAMTTSRHLNMATLEASIRRLQTTKWPQASRSPYVRHQTNSRAHFSVRHLASPRHTTDNREVVSHKVQSHQADTL
jgi:hypothetical protein